MRALCNETLHVVLSCWRNSGLAHVLLELFTKRLVFVCLIAAPEGVSAFQHAHPDIPIITAALDRQLDKNCYILPGLGDAGDRIYNTV